ncbi:MAG: glycosyltransferase [Candidatus Falkowbacteria bacterium]
MKKILILNTTFNKGGAAQVARDLFLHFNGKEKFSMFFAFGRGQKNNDPRIFYFGNKLEMFIHIFLVRFLGLEGFGTYFSTIKLINFIRRERFDLIHIHNLHGYYVNFFKLLKYLNKNNIKVVWTLHDEWLFTWLPAHSMDCSHCKTLKGKCVNHYDYPKNYFPVFSRFMLSRKRIILLFNNITFVSPANWLYDEAKFEFKLKNVALIPNGVDSNFFVPATDKNLLRKKYDLPLDKKIILFSANNFNDKNKGGEYFLSLAKSLEGQPYIFCVIGSADIPIYDNIIKLGYISDRRSLSEVYSLADLYCFLSAIETAPLSVMEAMSCGLPIVAFNIKALFGLVDSINGSLSKYGDVAEMAESINNIVGSDELLIDMGRESRNKIVKSFEQNNSYSAYEQLYKI